jgi:hypothetical protein
MLAFQPNLVPGCAHLESRKKEHGLDIQLKAADGIDTSCLTILIASPFIWLMVWMTFAKHFHFPWSLFLGH